MEGVSKKIGIDKIDLVRILEFLPYPFLVSEQRGDTQHNIFVNSRFLEEIGYSCDDLPTINDWFVAAYPEPTYREKIIVQWSDLVMKSKRERKDSFLMPAIIHTRNNGDVWYEVKASVHGPVHFVAFVNIDAKIKREEELKRLNHNKDQTLSMLSHDLRSPLVSLHSVLQMISAGKLSEVEKDTLLVKLTRQVFQMIEFLETTLNWTRTNFSASTVKDEQVNIPNLIQSIIDLYELSLAAKKIELKVDVGNGIVPTGDPEIYSIILRNVISNAVKYTPSGGQIKIIDYGKDTPYTIAIENTGSQISEKTIQHILERTVTSQTGTDGEKGLGLGLKLTQQLLEKTGGKIEISRQADSTLFKIIFGK